MNTRKTCFLLLLIMTGSFCGCVNMPELAQTGMETAYYILEYEPAATAVEKAPHALKVNCFTAVPLFSSKKIIYKQKNFQTSEYLYHQWHVLPAESIAYLLTRDLRQSGLVKAVFDPSNPSPAPFSIGGNLEVFLEDNSKQPWEAVLSIEIRLIDETEPDMAKSVMLQKQYTAAEPCARSNPRATAEAMSKAMQRVSAEIVMDVYEILNGLGG